MNQIILHGLLGKDPETSFTQGGKQVTKFTMATDNGKDKDPTWHNIVSWDKSAVLIEKYFKKGSEIIVTGKQEHRKYEEKYYSSVSMFTFEFCGKKDSNNSYTDKEADYSGGDAVADDSDVPF